MLSELMDAKSIGRNPENRISPRRNAPQIIRSSTFRQRAGKKEIQLTITNLFIGIKLIFAACLHKRLI